MYGEKFIEKKIDGNKIIRISEFKDFKHNYLDLIEDLNDYITDDWEALADRTIYFNRMEEFDNFEADSVLEWIEELIEEKKEDGEEEGEYAWLEKWIKPLEEAKGFTIHLNWKPEWVSQCDLLQKNTKEVRHFSHE